MRQTTALAQLDAEAHPRNWEGFVPRAVTPPAPEPVKQAIPDDAPAKLPTNMVNGYMVWYQNEFLDERIGPMPKPWKRRKDKRTGRCGRPLRCGWAPWWQRLQSPPFIFSHLPLTCLPCVSQVLF